MSLVADRTMVTSTMVTYTACFAVRGTVTLTDASGTTNAQHLTGGAFLAMADMVDPTVCPDGTTLPVGSTERCPTIDEAPLPPAPPTETPAPTAAPVAPATPTQPAAPSTVAPAPVASTVATKAPASKADPKADPKAAVAMAPAPRDAEVAVERATSNPAAEWRASTIKTRPAPWPSEDIAGMRQGQSCFPILQVTYLKTWQAT